MISLQRKNPRVRKVNRLLEMVDSPVQVYYGEVLCAKGLLERNDEVEGREGFYVGYMQIHLKNIIRSSPGIINLRRLNYGVKQ